MNRHRPVRRAAAFASACALLAAALAASRVSAQPAAATPLPHEAASPDTPLLPDYYALALAHTTLAPEPSAAALHLRLATGAPEPAVIVLPVQGQAFGFSPTFRALLGATLDHELARRHVTATRQTDIVDWRGPFVRRLPDAVVDEFAAAHPHAALLMPYLGHDGEGHAFVTLARRAGAKTSYARRRVVELVDDETGSLDRLAAALPPMLHELGLDGDGGAPAAPAATAGCNVDTWRLADIGPGTPAAADACHALAMGTLLPEALAVVVNGRPSSPDRAAWLARARVEAAAFGKDNPRMRSIADAAAVELLLDRSLEVSPAAPWLKDADPVARTVIRLLAAREQASRSPQRTAVLEASVALVRQAFAGEPAFATALAIERVRYREGFSTVDLCDAASSVQLLRTPSDCESTTGRPRPQPSRDQLALLEAWRVAQAWKEIDYEGRIQGNEAARERAIAALPPSLAAHPLVRVEGFATRPVHTADAGGLDDYLAHARRDVTHYAQAVATLQRSDGLLLHIEIGSRLIPQRSVLDDPVIVRARDDLDRLGSVLGADLFGSVVLPVRPGPPPRLFMADGSFAVARAAQPRSMSTLWRTPPPASGPFPPSRPLPAGPARMEAVAGISPDPLPSQQALEAERDNPNDNRSEGARAMLALQALKHGGTLAEAQRIIDDRPKGRRDDAILESDQLALAGHLFYFMGETALAKHYYELAARENTGAEQEMLSAVRVKALSGDLRGARVASQARFARYGGEWAMHDVGSQWFMTGRSKEAWQLLLPRAQLASNTPAWIAMLTGHRVAGTPLTALPAWAAAQRIDATRSTGSDVPIATRWLQAYATLDRVPSEADIALLARQPMPGTPSLVIGAPGALLMRAAIVDNANRLPAVFGDASNAMGLYLDEEAPFYAWDLARADARDDGGRDAYRKKLLDAFRAVSLDAGYNLLLAKAMVLATDGRRDEAQKFQAAARFELGRIGSTHPLHHNDFNQAPYHFVLASWLMARHTGDRAYAEPGLQIARAYQRVFPWQAWPYAAEALLSTDPKGRETAACRAQVLDAGSMFLQESGLHPDAKGAACRKATDW